METPPNQRSSGSRDPVKTLRDEFAMAALPAVIAAASAGLHMPIMREGETHIRHAICRDAYDMADAMMIARGRL